jgi:hypothetical protein
MIELLGITEAAMEGLGVKHTGQKTEELEKRLLKNGIVPVGRVKGTRDGVIFWRPVYHRQAVMAAKAERDSVSRSNDESLTDKRITRLEQLLKDLGE